MIDDKYILYTFFSDEKCFKNEYYTYNIILYTRNIIIII